MASTAEADPTDDDEAPDEPPLSERTMDSLMVKLAKQTGHVPPSRVTKPMWNSIHAHMTGEFLVRPADLGPGTPPYAEIAQQALIPVINECYAADRDEDDDPEPLERYRQHLFDVLDNNEERVRSMYRDELLDLVETVTGYENQRAWMDSL